MKILVTGATGFIGNHVISELVEKGHQVIASGTNRIKASSYKWFPQVDFREFTFDAIYDNVNLFEYFGKPDILIHLAWQRLPNYRDLFHIETGFFNQFTFLKNLIRNGIKYITITGTCLEYGMQNGCLQENAITMPSNSYALAKDSLRRFIEVMGGHYRFRFNWIRLFYMYGPGQYENSLIPLLEKAVKNGESEFKMSGGEQLRDYLPVQKVAQNIIGVSLQESVHGIFNCSSGEPISVKEFVKDYIEKNNYNIEMKLGVYPYPDYEPMAFWGDNRKISKILLRD
jgi:nucleoside-diphosphate-sugar epimerase